MADPRYDNLPGNLDPKTNFVQGGKLYTQSHPTKHADDFNYLGPASGYATLEEAQAADEAEGANSFVPASNEHPNGQLGKVLGTLVGASTGAEALASLLPAVLGFGGGGSSVIPSLTTAGSSIPVGGTTALFGAAPAASGGFLSSLGGASGALKLAANLGGGIANSVLQNKQTQAQQQIQRDQLAQQQAQFLASQAQQQKQFDSTQGQTQAQSALNATQDNPFKQAQARQGQAMLAALLSHASPASFDASGHMSGGIGGVLNPSTLAGVSAFATPEAMQANESAFTQNAKNASGGKYVPADPSKVGYPGAAAAPGYGVDPSVAGGTPDARAKLLAYLQKGGLG